MRLPRKRYGFYFALPVLMAVALTIHAQSQDLSDLRVRAVQSQSPDVVVPPAPRRDRGSDAPPVLTPRPAPTRTAAAPAGPVQLREGTPLPVRPTRRLDSSTDRSGDRFEAVLDEDVVDSRGELVLPRGTLLEGRLEEVRPGGRVSGRAEMTLLLDTLLIGGEAYPIRAEPILVQAQSSKKRDARNIGIGTAIGAAVGAIFGGGKGAVVGATIGGGASTARVMTTRGRDARIDKEQLVTFSLVERFDSREVRPGRP